MCPSNIYEMPVLPIPAFGPETEVFHALDSYPCSIVLKDVVDTADIRIQVKTELTDWKDYVEGDLIIGRSVMCRMAANGLGMTGNVKIEVFHT